MFDDLNSCFSLSGFAKSREQIGTDGGDLLRKDKCHSIVESLRANSPVFVCEDLEATQARFFLILFVPLRQKVCLINKNFARDIISSSKCFDLLKHGFLVLGLGAINYVLDNIEITLAHF
jgi:hypothetical protein